MVTKTLVNAVQSTLPAVDLFDAIIAEQVADITASAESLVSVERFEGDIADRKAFISSALYGVLISQGEPVTFAWYEIVRLEWRKAYNVAKGGGLSDSGLDNAWARAAKLVNDDYGISKPSSKSNDAEKKAEQRKKQEELIAEYVDTPVADIRSEIKELYLQAGDGNKDAKKQADKLVKVVDALTKAEVDEAKSYLKDTKKVLAQLLKECDDIEVLERVRDAFGYSK